MSNKLLSDELRDIIISLKPDMTNGELENYYEEFIKDSAIFLKIIEKNPSVKYSAFFIYHFLGYIKKDVDNYYKQKYDRLISIINE